MPTSTDYALSSEATDASREDGPSLEPGLLVTDRVRLVKELARGGMGTVWIAHHLTLGIDVAVKFLLVDDRMRRERLSREARLAARVDHPNAVRVFDHGVTQGGSPFIVMELLTGESLTERLERTGPLSLPEVRRLVAQVGSALTAAHQAGIVHRDVKPSNLMLSTHGDDLFVKLVDFGIAKPMDGADNTLTAVGHVVGTLFYMAPEQLIDGLSPDHRADLWGLAVVAYEALARRRPYGGHSLAAVGAAMVLRRYDPPSSFDPSLPRALDAWFDRALHLELDERFSSARELVETFEAAATSTAVGEPARRAAPVLRFPDRLFGRDRELAVLENALAAAGGGSRARVVLISGWSGVGKTALVEELGRRASVTFASGKCDAFDRGAPYQSLLQAFRDLVRRALADATTAAAFRLRFAERVGDAGRALLDTVPELATLVGEVTVDELSPAEQRNRFQLAVGRLVGAFGSPERPLVLFLDDLQWADLSTLDLWTRLATDPQDGRVLLVGAYRHNEVGPAHPLTASIERLRSSGGLDELSLGPLSEDAVVDLVSDVFPESPGRLRLASAAHGKTHGNAFFLRRFLETLVETGVVRFDPGPGRWTWDPERVDGLEMSDDVLDFVAGELQRMAPSAREALSVAACLGDRFDLELLARALGGECSDALERIGPALATELLVATGGPSSAPGPDERGRLVFRFTHDRVRQAALAALDAEATAAVHRRVGRYLLDHLKGAERERRLFELVEHLNRGFVSGADADDRARLSSLNLQAARRALRSAAFEAGHGYFGVARRHLEEDAWTRAYPTALAVHVEGARAAYLAGDPREMERLVDTAVAHARGVLDRVSAQEVRLQAFLSQQRFADALALAVEVLASLDLALPRSPGPDDVAAAVGDTLGRLSSFAESDLELLGACDDPVVQARQRIQIGAMSSAYMAAPTLLPILACNIVRATLDHGTCRESPYGFAALGLVLIAGNLVDAAYANGRIAADMLDRVGDRSMRPRTLHVLAAHVRLFVEPLRDSIEAERQVARLGLDVGDLEYAAWGLHVEVCNSFYAGVELGALTRTFERNRATLQHHQQHAALGCTVQYGVALSRLIRGPSAEADQEEAEQAARFRAGNFRGAAFIVAVLGGFTRYLTGDAVGALAFLDEGAEFADGAPATWHLVWFHQLRALSLLGCPGAGTEAAERAQPHLAQLRLWQRSSPVNHDHRVHLVDGEVARVSGRIERALAHFDEAVAGAAANGFLHEEALAHELASRCQNGAARTARLDRARAAWARWGATELVRRVDTRVFRSGTGSTSSTG